MRIQTKPVTDKRPDKGYKGHVNFQPKQSA